MTELERAYFQLETLKREFLEQEELLQDALSSINALSDALDSIYDIAKSFPLDKSSLSIRDIAYKAVKAALSKMDQDV